MKLCRRHILSINAGLRATMLTTRLITYREYKLLFPDCEIWVERMLWIIPKSYVAYRL